MKNLKNKIKNMKGITLISLVITIIILIILAGITLNMLLGENGIINRTKTARDENERATATETMNLKITNVQISKYAEEQRMPTLKELADNFCEDDDFQYVQETSEVASLTKITNNNPTSIYTKLKAYPYEFEINSSLQLASIDGVKVASTSSSDTVSREEYNALLTRISALETTGSSNPTGTIIAYSVNNVPTGYLKCEGQEVSRTTYSNLFNIIGTTYGDGDGSTTFKLPDLRGEFLRGSGDNSHTNQGSGGTVGEHQDGTISPWITAKTDGSQIFIRKTNDENPPSPSNYDYKLYETKGIAGAVSTYNANGSSTIQPSQYTSRPTNTSVLYCIKY